MVGDYTSNKDLYTDGLVRKDLFIFLLQQVSSDYIRFTLIRRSAISRILMIRILIAFRSRI